MFSSVIIMYIIVSLPTVLFPSFEIFIKHFLDSLKLSSDLLFSLFSNPPGKFPQVVFQIIDLVFYGMNVSI